MKVRRVDFSPDEWIAGTVGLDNAERGLYITACALIYSAGGPICVEHLRANCRDHGHAYNRQLARLVALGKLTVNDGQIVNKRAINELQSARKRFENASQNGVLGNKIKKLKNATRSSAASANHQPSPSPKSIVVTKVTTPSSRALRTKELNQEFAEVWLLYPRHVGKGAALKAYHKARQSTDAETLREAVEQFALARAGEDQQFTPHMSTWLNAQRWLDDDKGGVIDHGYPGPIGPKPTIEEVFGQRP